MNQSIDHDIKELLKEVPPQIKAVFASGKVGTVAASLIQKYRLHVDQAGIVEREVSLLVLALVSPGEFAQTLSEEAKLDVQTIRAIMQDINEQIFVPIRKEMEASRTGATQSTPRTPPRVIPLSVPMPNYSAPPLQSPRYAPRDTKIGVSVVAPLPPKVTMPHATGNQTQTPSIVKPISSVPAQQSQSVVAPKPALPAGEEESVASRLPEVHASVQVPQLTPAVPVATPLPPTPVAPVVPPVIPKVEVPTTPPSSIPESPLAPPPTPIQRAADPYREPIE